MQIVVGPRCQVRLIYTVLVSPWTLAAGSMSPTVCKADSCRLTVLDWNTSFCSPAALQTVSSCHSPICPTRNRTAAWNILDYSTPWVFYPPCLALYIFFLSFPLSLLPSLSEFYLTLKYLIPSFFLSAFVCSVWHIEAHILVSHFSIHPGSECADQKEICC
jgi:hypothetical protein